MPYKIESIDSNDTLYGNNSDYLTELGQLITTCMEEIIQQLTLYTSHVKIDNNSRLIQVRLVMQFTMRIVTSMVLNTEVCKFVVKLLELVQKQSQILTKQDINVYKNCQELLMSIARTNDEESTQMLVNYLQSL